MGGRAAGRDDATSTPRRSRSRMRCAISPRILASYSAPRPAACMSSKNSRRSWISSTSWFTRSSCGSAAAARAAAARLAAAASCIEAWRSATPLRPCSMTSLSRSFSASRLGPGAQPRNWSRSGGAALRMPGSMRLPEKLPGSCGAGGGPPPPRPLNLGTRTPAVRLRLLLPASWNDAVVLFSVSAQEPLPLFMLSDTSCMARRLRPRFDMTSSSSAWVCLLSAAPSDLLRCAAAGAPQDIVAPHAGRGACTPARPGSLGHRWAFLS
mmetsp:Transcript_27581/g.81666  ORF Transcript_27581/g.81666 Transcript_27581/m.81666 type:complete len:267 (+) Transcript_27581:74-874(+)